jgi:hypothetical protein
MKTSRPAGHVNGPAPASRRKPKLPPLIARFRAAARQIPRRELRNLPADFIENLDHYLYGTPRA